MFQVKTLEKYNKYCDNHVALKKKIKKKNS